MGKLYLTGVISASMWHAPKKQTHSLRMEKKVKINNEEANWTNPLKKNDVSKFIFSRIKSSAVQPTFLIYPILYEDDHLLVVNKPSNMDTHPNHLLKTTHS